MKLGFVTGYSEKAVSFAGKSGFDCLEVFAEMGSSMDLDKLSADDVGGMVEYMKKNGVAFSSISCNPCHLSGDARERARNTGYFKRAITRCKEFGTNIVVTGAFADRRVSIKTNLETYAEVFSEYAEEAEKHGVKIAIENCPHWVGYPLTVGNIGFSPEMFDKMFDLVPSKAIGVEFDPSHLFWQGIDDVAMLKRFGDRIYSVHAKDTEIFEDKRKYYGIVGKSVDKENEWESGWWIYRIPGFGQINWIKIFNTLRELSYDGPVVIEHEDPVFSGGPSELGTCLTKTQEGLLLGLNYLKKVIPSV